MGPGAECFALRDENDTQIWHPPGIPFCAVDERNMNREGGVGKKRGRRFTSVKQSNFLHILDCPRKNFTQKCREACLPVSTTIHPP